MPRRAFVRPRRAFPIRLFLKYMFPKKFLRLILFFLYDRPINLSEVSTFPGSPASQIRRILPPSRMSRPLGLFRLSSLFYLLSALILGGVILPIASLMDPPKTMAPSCVVLYIDLFPFLSLGLSSPHHSSYILSLFFCVSSPPLVLFLLTRSPHFPFEFPRFDFLSSFCRGLYTKFIFLRVLTF